MTRIAHIAPGFYRVPLPTVLGGSCVTFGDIAVPLLVSSKGQIQAQVPDTLPKISLMDTTASPKPSINGSTQVGIAKTF